MASPAHRLKHALQMPIVYITAHAGRETVERAKVTEPFGYVITPVADAACAARCRLLCTMQSQRMEAVAGLAGALAHDFNNLLMIMMGSADELCAWLSAEEQRPAAEIRQSAAIASCITQQLLILSRPDAARIEVANLNDVICEFQPLISHTLWAEAIHLATDCGSPASSGRGDRSRLKQMLLNLAFRKVCQAASSR
jgi:signal transduction histidine kinase